MIDSSTSLLGLFISGFTSATLLPGSSEALFLWMLSLQVWDTAVLIFIVGLGNSLGGMSNWLLGVLIHKGIYHNKKSVAKVHFKAEVWLKKYGSPILFFSFLPIIGDPLCVVAGWVKIPWFKALLFIILGKFSRYLALSYVFFY